MVPKIKLVKQATVVPRTRVELEPSRESFIVMKGVEESREGEDELATYSSR